MAAPATRTPFPAAIEDFGADERISYSKLDNKWILEDDDGSEWEFNEGAQKWIATLDESLLQNQSRAYQVAGVDEAEPAAPNKKRKKEDSQSANGSKKHKSDDVPRKITSVYVTNLPKDTTIEEITEVFGKYGMIAESPDSGEKRVKMYNDEQGLFKGEALVTYFKEESVSLVIHMLDESDFRFGVRSENGTMRVAKADFSHKASDNSRAGEPPKKKSAKEKKIAAKKYEEMSSKLAEWSDDEPSTLPPTSSRYDKVVVMKYMFTLAELEEDPAALLDIKEDIREECAQFGEVTNVVLFDKEEDGVVTVRFANTEAARACVRRNDGRDFAGRKVQASIADGSEKFKKSGRGNVEEDNEEEEEKRLAKFGEWLDKGGDDAKDA